MGCSAGSPSGVVNIEIVIERAELVRRSARARVDEVVVELRGLEAERESGGGRVAGQSSRCRSG